MLVSKVSEKFGNKFGVHLFFKNSFPEVLILIIICH